MTRKLFSSVGLFLALTLLLTLTPHGMEATDMHARRASPEQTYWCADIILDTTWYAANSPYIVTCDVDVLATLTLELDTEVRFYSGTGLYVLPGGRLVGSSEGGGEGAILEANTTTWSGIDVLTAGEVGGALTVRDAETGLFFYPGSKSTLKVALLSGNDTGLESVAARIDPISILILRDNGIGLEVTGISNWDPCNVLIASQNQYAVRVSGASVSLGGAFIYDNTYGVYLTGDSGSTIQAYFQGNDWAVYHATADSCVDASGSWWGDDSGPLDSSAAPDLCEQGANYGSGDAVTDNVRYAPWIRQFRDRGLYIDDFELILGHEELESQLLEIANEQSVNYLALYGLHLSGMGTELSDFIARAKSEYAIDEVGAIGENSAFFDDVEEFNENFELHFDVLNLEFEYWNEAGRPFDEYLSTLQHMRAIADAQGLIVEAYLGWPTRSEAQQIGPLVDRVLLHAYVEEPEQAYLYTRERLEYFASNQELLEVWPIFSLEPDFMGPWMEDHSFTEAEATYLEDFENEGGEWISFITLGGFQWFTYSLAQELPWIQRPERVFLPIVMRGH